MMKSGSEDILEKGIFREAVKKDFKEFATLIKKEYFIHYGEKWT